MLFADLREFTPLCERLGSETTFELLGEIMDRLSDAVVRYSGSIIDYYGDGLSAFWNAPVDQADHASLACHAALAMQNEMCQLNSSWRHRLGRPIRLGIGIHTGPAQVGNAGSRFRLKYGPRGSTVNLASRIEQANKELAVPILISAETASQVGHDLGTLRLGRFNLKGTVSELDLYQLSPATDQMNSPSFVSKHQRALSLIESGDPSKAIELLQELVDYDLPNPAVTHLLDRAVKEQEERAIESSPALENAEAPTAEQSSLG